MKLVNMHPADRSGLTHNLTLTVTQQCWFHQHVIVESECGLIADNVQMRGVPPSKSKPTCETCLSHGLAPNVLSGVMAALERAGNL